MHLNTHGKRGRMPRELRHHLQCFPFFSVFLFSLSLSLSLFVGFFFFLFCFYDVTTTEMVSSDEMDPSRSCNSVETRMPTCRSTFGFVENLLDLVGDSKAALCSRVLSSRIVDGADSKVAAELLLLLFAVAVNTKGSCGAGAAPEGAAAAASFRHS